LFKDETFFNKDEITNTRNSRVCFSQEENPHAITDANFQTRFFVNILCRMIPTELIGPSELEDRLAGERY
jgi:hypothetical protein